MSGRKQRDGGTQDPAEQPAAREKSENATPADTSDQPTAEELATQKVQDSPLGLADQAAAKKAKEKAEKTRLSDRPKQPDQTPQPYLGQPAPVQAAPAASQPQVPGAPASGPAGATP